MRVIFLPDTMGSSDQIINASFILDESRSTNVIASVCHKAALGRRKKAKHQNNRRELSYLVDSLIA